MPPRRFEKAAELLEFVGRDRRPPDWLEAKQLENYLDVRGNGGSTRC